MPEKFEKGVLFTFENACIKFFASTLLQITEEAKHPARMNIASSYRNLRSSEGSLEASQSMLTAGFYIYFVS